ncbi:MAG: hypothetical protein QOG10_579 [Kribbellaceae bacterium]|jgi:hypothetical protein|nr:hypothetical protein [Kribbellaceae bacterium]
MTSTDWLEWHARYDDQDSPLSRRLQAVQRGIRGHLEARPDQPVRAISACAGQGRDLIEVLASHPARATRARSTATSARCRPTW